MASSWERLASVTLGSAADTINSGTITAKTHLKFTFELVPNSSDNVEPDMRFNSDSGTNYAMIYGNDGATDNSYSPRDRLYIIGNTGGANEPAYCTGSIINISDQEKHVTSHSIRGATGNTVPQRREFQGRWANTSAQITSIQVFQDGSGDFGVGSTLTVWGLDDGVAFYPNLVNGAIFEESETGTHYMWDGTDTWNEVT